MVMLCKNLEKTDLPLFLAVNKEDWLAEIKEDGDRVRMLVKNKQISLSNRRGNDVTAQYPEFKEINLPDCFLDGEMVVLDENGVSQFNEGISFRTHCKNSDTIRKAMGEYPVTYKVFDVLEVDGLNVRNQKLTERRTILESLNLEVAHANIKLVQQSDDVMALWNEAVARGEEGIIIKLKSSKYDEFKRSNFWRKVKDVKEVDLVFQKYEEHAKGITVENVDGIRCVINGNASLGVKKQIDTCDECVITIRHLGQTKSGKYRQPVFLKEVV